jgi:Copper type II ascorbate-dependent monooxygenase, C-terminal domain
VRESRNRLGLGLVAAAVCACSSHGAQGSIASSSRGAVTLDFAIDAPLYEEQRECFGFDAAQMAGRWLNRIAWTPPASGGPSLHHATLFAVAGDYPDGPVVCDAMPNSWTMHVWAPGGDALALPDGVALVLPSGTQRLVVQAHVLRFVAGPPAGASVTLETTDVAPSQVAAWLPAVGGVPAIPPHTEDHSTTTCPVAAPMHVWSAWPHMHLLGQSFQGAIVRANGTRSVFVDVAPWDFGEQRTYAVDQDVEAGDGIETDCTWVNPTDQYVLPGLSTNDEMCGDGLIVWPAQAATRQGPCQ